VSLYTVTYGDTRRLYTITYGDTKRLYTITYGDTMRLYRVKPTVRRAMVSPSQV
jgi:hypothetical protein